MADARFPTPYGLPVRAFLPSNAVNYTTGPNEVTIIAATTPNRLTFLPSLLKRWPGQFSIAVKVKAGEERLVRKTLRQLSLPDRVRLVLYLTPPKHKHYLQFPVNKLRNLAIVNIVTTHFLVLDMDMWPIHSLYTEIQRIPKDVMDSDSSAIIVPAFFLKKEAILSKCGSLMECAMVSERNFPGTREELKECVDRGDCLLYKHKTITHRYVNMHWFSLRKSFAVMRVRCFANRFQEPYVIVRYTPSTLLFDERFVDYGCNKVQYIDHLRHMGYKFYIMTNAFAMDIAHYDSHYRKDYISRLHSTNMPNMRLLCYDYQRQLRELYPFAKNQTRICTSEYESLYRL